MHSFALKLMSLQGHSAKLRSAILVGCVLSSFVLTALTAPALGQTAPLVQTEPQSSYSATNLSEELKPGVVVEKISKGSKAEKAGLQEGDILLNWISPNAQGEIKSPFDLLQMEFEQSSRGTVRIEGLRGREKQVWLLESDIRVFDVRPN